jgi:uncharacterized phage infection (PIP) family protein YhgE
MKLFFVRLAGVLLVFGAILGTLLTGGSAYYIWSTKNSVTQQLIDNIDLFDRSIHTTSDGLKVAELSLDKIRNSIALVKASTHTLASSIEQTGPSVQSLSKLVGNDLPGIVIDTRQSLTAAEDSARLVDDTLRIVSAIPFIGPRYKPAVPLQQSVQNVNQSLQNLPASFYQMQQGILTADQNMQTFKKGIDDLSLELDTFDSSLAEALSAVQQYQDISKELITRVDHFQTSFPVWLQRSYLILSLFLFWLVLLQISLLIQGLQLLGKTL